MHSPKHPTSSLLLLPLLCNLLLTTTTTTTTATATATTTTTTTTTIIQLDAVRAGSALSGRLPLWHSLMGQNRLRLNSEWQRQKAPRNPQTNKPKTRQRAEPIRNEPEPKTCGGSASAQGTLGLDAGQAMPTCCGVRPSRAQAPMLCIHARNFWASTHP